jgi:dimethylhistidine N-methyltransferase
MTTTSIPLLDLHPPQDDLIGEVRHGLHQDPALLPCKLLYDKAGSELFDRICELPEYYPTRTEMAIMDAHVHDMAAAIGPEAVVIELGSGSSTKTPMLLEALQDPVGYVPVEISRDHLLESALRIREQFADLEVLPVCADYTRPLEIPATARPGRRRVLYFPGSTIGNFHPQDASAFLRRLADVAGPGGALLIGADLRKPPEILVPAYDDAQGVTAAFNLNLLHRLAAEPDVAVDPGAFEHEAVWNDAHSRIEMRLVAQRPTDIRVGEERFRFETGQYIRSECSYKHTLDGFAQLAAGWEVQRIWTDPRQWFSVQYLTV